MNPRVPRRVVGYGVAVLMSGAALLVRRVLTRQVGSGLPAFLTFSTAVMLSTTLYGLGPGLLATVLSAALAAYSALLRSAQFLGGQG
jgi:hypothetical protein